MRVTVISANYGGGKDKGETIGLGYDRYLEFSHYIEKCIARTGNGAVAIQEYPGRPHDYEQSLPDEHLTEPFRREFYVPMISTRRYPLVEKWGKWWAEGNSTTMEEGMATWGVGSLMGLADPAVALHDKSQTPFGGLVLDLPILEFGSTVESGWIEDAYPFDEGIDMPMEGGIKFRPTFYHGNRDTEPRIATAHRVWVGGLNWSMELPQFILINVHLATLKEEWDGDVKLDSSDDLLRSIRRPTRNARYLRWRQLLVLREFILRVYREQRLPVVVAGDFNAEIDAPEMQFLLNEAHLVSTLPQGVCYQCGEPYQSKPLPVTLYGTRTVPLILSANPDNIRRWVGAPSLSISVPEVCANKRCAAPRFTHKQNFKLIDHIFHTDDEQILRPGLLWRLRCAGLGASGIDLETYFSDHLPIWANIEILTG